MSARFAIALALLATACCVNPFRNTQTSGDTPSVDPEEAARRSIAPAQPAVQPSQAGANEPGAGFDIRLVRVQPGVHIGTEQSCDVIFTTRPETVAGEEAGRYAVDATHRMAVSCHAPSGDGWADLVFSPEHASQLPQIRRGTRIRVRLLTSDGGYVDYPVVQFVALEGQNAELARTPPRAQPATVPNGFDLRQLRDDPGLIGTTQQCAVAEARAIELVRATEQRPRSYPAGTQNRMTIACKHAGGEELADLVFMPAQALAALDVRRGSVIPVRIISRDGGQVEYPILQFAGQ